MFAKVSRLFTEAERSTSLLARCRPANATLETERVARSWEAGHPEMPEFRYGPAEALGPLRRALDAVFVALDGKDGLSTLHAARAAELSLEATMVEAIGTCDFAGLAAKRFAVDASEVGVRADADAESWVGLSVPTPDESVLADDASDPLSLVSQVRALAFALRLPVRVTTSAELSSSAATGPGFIVVRAGARHRPEAARRIAAHEVVAHALPRVRAADEPLGLFATGTAGSGSDEEGRALVIEEESGLFDTERRRELAGRHLAAVATRRGADFVETVRLLVGRGLPPREAVFTAARAQRGGGLAREIVYLPARHRVRAALDLDPGLLTWLARGRLSLDAARTLRALGLPGGSRAQRNVATTGV